MNMTLSIGSTPQRLSALLHAVPAFKKQSTSARSQKGFSQICPKSFDYIVKKLKTTSKECSVIIVYMQNGCKMFNMAVYFATLLLCTVLEKSPRLFKSIRSSD